MARDVFISHSSDDPTEVGDICGLFDQHGLSYWISSRDIPPGKDYQVAIIDAIQESCATVLVLSENSNKSDQVKFEIERSVAYGKAPFTIRIHDVKPSKALELFISSAQWIDRWESSFGWRIEQLVKEIHALKVDAQKTSDPIRTQVTQVKKSTNTKIVFHLSACMIMLIAAGGYWYLRPTTISHSPVSTGWNLPLPDSSNITPLPGKYSFSQQGCFEVVDKPGNAQFTLRFSRDCFRFDSITVTNGSFQNIWGEIGGTHCPTDAYAISGAFISPNSAQGTIKFGSDCRITVEKEFTAELRH